MPLTEVGTVAFVLELAMQHSAILGELILASYEHSMKSINTSSPRQQPFSYNDALLLLIVSHLDLLKEKVIHFCYSQEAQQTLASLLFLLVSPKASPTLLPSSSSSSSSQLSTSLP